MDHDPSLARTRSIGRLVSWLILAILAASAVYAASIAVQNWSAIGV